jgi:hypothetical protein
MLWCMVGQGNDPKDPQKEPQQAREEQPVWGCVENEKGADKGTGTEKETQRSEEVGMLEGFGSWLMESGAAQGARKSRSPSRAGWALTSLSSVFRYFSSAARSHHRVYQSFRFFAHFFPVF